MDLTDHQRPKYSLIETERKWIVDKSKMPELSGLTLIEVTDKYFLGTRTRLRRMENTDTHDIQYKLTKKYGKISPISEPLTTLYLTESEFNFYNSLKGAALIKKIYRFPFEGKIFLIEVFIKPEVDFILLEVEASSVQEIDRLRIPEFAMEDVTNKKEYEGYTIACRGT